MVMVIYTVYAKQYMLMCQPYLLYRYLSAELSLNYPHNAHNKIYQHYVFPFTEFVIVIKSTVLILESTRK